MPWVDYNGVQDEIKDIIDSDPDMWQTSVVSEEEFPFNGFSGDWVGIYFNERIVPATQTLSAGQVVKIELQYSIWCISSSLDPKRAYRERNNLLAKVEKILTKNINLNDKFNVEFGFLFGGEIVSVKDADDHNIGAGEIIFSVLVKATTT